VSAGGATTARAIADVVTAINITDGGNGNYTSPPTVTITSVNGAAATATLGSGGSAGQVVSTVITDHGSFYTTPPTVTFSAAPTGGVTATGVAAISGGQVTGITITNAGSRYVTAPTIPTASI